jgi:hypothetical protein
MTLANFEELIGFLVVVGLQVYTRLGLGKIEKNQQLILVKHDASRGELDRLVDHLAQSDLENTSVIHTNLADTIGAALRVSYLQGQADAGSDKEYPEARAMAAAKKLAEIAIQLTRNGSKGLPPVAGGPAPPVKP